MKVKFCLVSSMRISHFGRNPVKGGRPPRDSRVRGVMAKRMGVFVQEVDSELIVVEWENLNVKNKENVSVIYVIKVKKVRGGEY